MSGVKKKCGSDFLTVILEISRKLKAFRKVNIYFFNLTVVKTMSELWNSFCKIWNGDVISENKVKFMNMLTSVTSSNASVERIFSTIAVAHSKLRNRLGV